MILPMSWKRPPKRTRRRSTRWGSKPRCAMETTIRCTRVKCPAMYRSFASTVAFQALDRFEALLQQAVGLAVGGRALAGSSCLMAEHFEAFRASSMRSSQKAKSMALAIHIVRLRLAMEASSGSASAAAPRRHPRPRAVRRGRVDLGDVVRELGGLDEILLVAQRPLRLGSRLLRLEHLGDTPSTGNFLPIRSGARFAQGEVTSVFQTLTLRMSGRSARSWRTIEVELSPTPQGRPVDHARAEHAFAYCVRLSFASSSAWPRTALVRRSSG